eukprot:g2887.t1
MRRSNRGNKSYGAKKADALAKLRSARSAGGSHSGTAITSLELQDEGDVYDEVTEEEYRELVKRRQREEDFVVDDDQAGYIDDGEEHLFEAERREDRIRQQREQEQRLQAEEIRKKSAAAQNSKMKDLWRQQQKKRRRELQEKAKVKKEAELAQSSTNRSIGDFDFEAEMQASAGYGARKKKKRRKKIIQSSSYTMKNAMMRQKKKKVIKRRAIVDDDDDQDVQHHNIETEGQHAHLPGKEEKTDSNASMIVDAQDFSFDTSNFDNDEQGNDQFSNDQQSTSPTTQQQSPSAAGTLASASSQAAATSGMDISLNAVKGKDNDSKKKKKKVLSIAEKRKQKLFDILQRKQTKRSKAAQEAMDKAIHGAIQGSQQPQYGGQQQQSGFPTTSLPVFFEEKKNVQEATTKKDENDDSMKTEEEGEEEQKVVVEEDKGTPPKSYMYMYYTDAYEDPKTNPGTAFLFGKTLVLPNGQPGDPKNPEHVKQGKFKSTCIAIANLERCLYFLPRTKEDYEEKYGKKERLLRQKARAKRRAERRAQCAEAGEEYDSADDSSSSEEESEEEEEFGDSDGEDVGKQTNASGKKTRNGRLSSLRVYEEVSGLMEKLLPKAGTFKSKPVTRKYAFEIPDIPTEETEYLQVRYHARYRCPKQGMQGKTFAHMFGGHQSALETFLLETHLMGPSWIKISCPYAPPSASRRVSFAHYEAAVSGPHDISVLQGTEAPTMTPPMVVSALELRTIVNPVTHAHEIVMASLLTAEPNAVRVDKPAAHQTLQNMTRLSILRPLTDSVAAMGNAQTEAGQKTGTVLPLGFKQKIRQKLQRTPSVGKKTGQAASQNIIVESNERALLNCLMVQLRRVDPDIITGHNITNFALDVLMRRCEKLKVQTWSMGLCRLKRTKFPQRRQTQGDLGSLLGRPTPGRLLVDTYITSKELVRQPTFTLLHLVRTYLPNLIKPTTKQSSTSSSSLTKGTISESELRIDPLDVPKYFADSHNLFYLIEATEKAAYATFSLMCKLDMVPLSKQLTSIGGNLWARTLAGGRAERIEYLLLHEFFSRGYIVPDKEVPSFLKWRDPNSVSNQSSTKDKKKTKGRKRGKAKYAGGLVLEPKKGLYDKFVLLLDFNSLYPSIIQEYNLCYTTVQRTHGGTVQRSLEEQAAHNKRKELLRQEGLGTGRENEQGDQGEEEAFVIPNLPDLTEFSEEGILPRMCRTLVERRRVVKRDMKKERNPEKKNSLNIKQMALKITVNSMYGCLGFSNSRFYAAPIAALVTSQGREILQKTVEMTENKGYNVVYGDTDSIMVYTGLTDYPKVMEIGRTLKRDVNKLYRKLEIDIDGVFKSMLLLKKKKYAALLIEGERKNPHTGEVELITKKEVKGIDLVRRDWCPLSKEIGLFVLDQILHCDDTDAIVPVILDKLANVAKDVRGASLSGDVLDVAKFVVTKGLNKSPTEYPNPMSQPHLVVALRMLNEGQPVNVGDHIPYVITTTVAPVDPKGRVRTNGATTSSKKKSTPMSTQGMTPSQLAKLLTPSNETERDFITYPASTVEKHAMPVPGSYALRAAHPETVLKSRIRFQAEKNNQKVILQQQQQKSNTNATDPENDQHVSNNNNTAVSADTMLEATKTPQKGGGGNKNSTLVPYSILDVEWYLTNQILPPISRLCSPIEGLDSARLASSLGLKYNVPTYSNGNDQDDLDEGLGFIPTAKLEDSVRYRTAMPLLVKCPECSAQIAVNSPFYFFDENGKSIHDRSVHIMTADLLRAKNIQKCVPILEQGCLKCGCQWDESLLRNSLTLASRHFVRKYYEYHLVNDLSADDATTSTHVGRLRTNQQSVMGRWMQPHTTASVHKLMQDYDASQLYTQLKFLESCVFNTEKITAMVDSLNQKARVENVAKRAKAIGQGKNIEDIELSTEIYMPKLSTDQK